MKIGRLMSAKGGEFDVQDAMRDGAKVTGSGGVKIKESRILDEFPHPTRYAFTLTGSAPKSLVLSDLTTMLEARFRGELGTALTRSRDEAVQRLKSRLDKRVEKLGEEEAHYRAMAAELEAKKAEYEKTADDIRAQVEEQEIKDMKQKEKALRVQIADMDQRRIALENEHGTLEDSVEGRKKARERATERALESIRVHPVSDRVYMDSAQVLEIADNLVSSWQESLQDYGQPMPSEYEELTTLLAKTFEKLVDRVNDAFTDKLRISRSSENTPEKAEPSIVSDDRLF